MADKREPQRRGEERRKRSQRNSIVTVLTGIASAAVAVEQGAPALLPSGSGIVAGQLATLAALLVNLFWPR